MKVLKFLEKKPTDFGLFERFSELWKYVEDHPKYEMLMKSIEAFRHYYKNNLYDETKFNYDLRNRYDNILSRMVYHIFGSPEPILEPVEFVKKYQV